MTGPDSEGLQAEADVTADYRRCSGGYDVPGMGAVACRHDVMGPHGPSSPVVPSVEVGSSALARMLDEYLTTRGHTLSTAHLTGFEQLRAEADYILGEALELRDAIRDLASAAEEPGAVLDHLWLHAEREMADVVLATTTLAGMMPGKPTIESCIAEKTEADRDRG